MNEPLSTERQLALIQDLYRRSAERAKAEEQFAASFRRRGKELERTHAEGRERLVEKHEADRKQEDEEYQQAKRDVESQSEREHDEAQSRYGEIFQKANERFGEQEQAADKTLEEAKWEASAQYDVDTSSPSGKLTPQLKRVGEYAVRLAPIQVEANRLRQAIGLPASEPAQQLEPGTRQDAAFARLTQCLAAAEEVFARLTAYRRRPILKALFLCPLFLAAWVMMELAASMVYRVKILEAEGLPWLAGTLAISVVLGGLVLSLRSLYRKGQVRSMCESLCMILGEADAARQFCQSGADQQRQQQSQRAQQHQDKGIASLDQKYQRFMKQITRERDTVIKKADAELKRQISQATQRGEKALREIEKKHQRRSAELKECSDAELPKFDERHQGKIAENRDAERKAWIDLAVSWQETIESVRSNVLEINRASEALFPGWMKPCWKQWQPPRQVPPAIRFGELEIHPANIPGGIPKDDRLKEKTLSGFLLPALTPFPSAPSILYKAHGEGREASIRSLQAVMLRMLTSLPAGKVRFTIIDPVGLGENFAGFMHLADFDESLVNSRIWTETEHIESKLADLSEHLENVIQTYLRNEYESIEAYNKEAGEVAEPFRILVVANFPANFSEKAVKRLISIAGSGPRCGVCTLIAVDTKQKLPPGCRLKDLEQHSTVLTWNGKQFVWQHEVFKNFPLQLESPPPADLFTSIIQQVGEHSKDANRVELPFKNVVPAAEDLWTGDCSVELVAPLGQSGATKLQYLRLGRGTSQHVVVAGKTGSGKSTMLHVLITSLALRYSPDEVQLYLIDFKKGVEFKVYVTQQLPHARVVAVESEREFGLSVLQRLDKEMTIRGDAYREVGAQDVKSYRDATGKPLPRILLLIDEFQELFVEDDRIASESSRLLDRLVRQGRAFGLHVLLGSQTLGGAYSLPRTTLGQMAVRIALECSEADASLILAEGNSAARLLSRPGDAIYNDANGRIEGNKPFQIAWLPDAEREGYLKQARELAVSRGYEPPEPMIVFEGNAPADLEKNQSLTELIEASSWPSAAPLAAAAWMGDPVAIKEPTAATFRRQGGSNLLMVGQRESAALGILASSVISLANQYAPGGSNTAAEAKFRLLDGSRGDAEHAGFLAALAEKIPHDVQAVTWREADQVIADIAAEVARRSTENDFDAPSIFLIIHDLGRFRSLRRDENAYGGLGGLGGESEATPSQQFISILQDGSALGVHVLVWCDTLTALNRALDRQTLREFEQRVVFQMSGDDSSNLIDTPVASQLGHYRALYRNEESDSLEKFRPYNPPDDAWLSQVQSQMAARGAPPSGSGGKKSGGEESGEKE